VLIHLGSESREGRMRNSPELGWHRIGCWRYRSGSPQTAVVLCMLGSRVTIQFDPTGTGRGIAIHQIRNVRRDGYTIFQKVAGAVTRVR